jgi:hypothetical protein
VRGWILCVNPLNSKLYPICHLLALLGAQSLLHVSRIRVNVDLAHIRLNSSIEYDTVLYNSIFLSGFSGLGVACWPLVPKFAGSKPGRSRLIFQGEKILSTTTFGGEVKAVCPMSQICGM